MAEKDGKIAPYQIHTGDDNIHKPTETQTLKPNDEHYPLRKEIAQMPTPPELEDIKNFETILLASPLWTTIKKRLESSRVEVKNIVCMALGSPYECENEVMEQTNKLSRESCTQHLLACAIANHLSQRYRAISKLSSPPTDIPIYAYDPDYTLPALRVLSHLSPPITVVSDPHHYLSITPSTLVIAICAPVWVPIYEIAADLCSPSGPAALLCNEIYTHPWHAEGKIMKLDQWAPRVGRMLDLYEKQWLGAEFVGDGEEEESEEEESEEEENEEEEKHEQWRDQGMGGWEQDMFWYARRE